MDTKIQKDQLIIKDPLVQGYKDGEDVIIQYTRVSSNHKNESYL